MTTWSVNDIKGLDTIAARRRRKLKIGAPKNTAEAEMRTCGRAGLRSRRQQVARHVLRLHPARRFGSALNARVNSRVRHADSGATCVVGPLASKLSGNNNNVTQRVCQLVKEAPPVQS